MIDHLTPLQKLSKNGDNLGKLNVAKGFKKLPKVQLITQSGHPVTHQTYICHFYLIPLYTQSKCNTITYPKLT